MRMEWKRRLGGIAALLGVLAVLLSATAPAAAHASSDRNLARASHQDAGLLPQAGFGERPVDRPGLTTLDPASRPFASGSDVPLPDCPHSDGKTCCAMAACPAFSMAFPAGTAFAVTWAGMAVDFTAMGAAGHVGLDAPPLTPPPRQDA